MFEKVVKADHCSVNEVMKTFPPLLARSVNTHRRASAPDIISSLRGGFPAKYSLHMHFIYERLVIRAEALSLMAAVVTQTCGLSVFPPHKQP